MNVLRLAFMGTSDFALPTLKALIESGHQIVACYTQSAKPSGRGLKHNPSPVELVAKAAGIPVHTPKSLYGQEQVLENLALDAIIVVAYGLLLPQSILAIPRLGCINLHASLLPRWRGAAPIQRAIMKGDKETGISVMLMTKGLDEGPILLQKHVIINDDENWQGLQTRLADLGASSILETLNLIDHQQITPQAQSATGITYAHKISKIDEIIDWTQPAPVIMAQIRALSPKPAAFIEINGERIKIIAAEIVSCPPNIKPASIIDDDFTIACSTGAIRPILVQRAGRKIMNIADFLRGFQINSSHVE